MVPIDPIALGIWLSGIFGHAIEAKQPMCPARLLLNIDLATELASAIVQRSADARKAVIHDGIGEHAQKPGHFHGSVLFETIRRRY
jgi:hypothetical protein